MIDRVASSQSRVTEDRQATYSIGDFARLSGVTAKALRHYDRIGVLRPAVVDAQSRYRRYSPDQLIDLYELLSFARLGLSLRQARETIGRQDTSDSLSRALLAAKREIEARVAEDQGRLAWIELKLAELRGEVGAAANGGDTSSVIVLKKQPLLPVIAVRARLATYGDADTLLDEISTDDVPAFGRSSLRGTVWHDCGVETGVIDCEAVVLAESGHRRRSRVHRRMGRARDLPAATLACVIHRGGDESVRATYAAAHRWIATNGFAIVGPNREWYLGSARGEPVMEIQFPVSPIRQPS